MSRGADITYDLSFHVRAAPFRQNAERRDADAVEVDVDLRLLAIIADALLWRRE